MDIDYMPTICTIRFSIERKDDAFIDKVCFVSLLQQKFNGEVDDAHTWKEPLAEGGKRKWYVYRIKFSDLTIFGHAQSHCYSNLRTNGEIKSSYIGALDHNDMGRRIAMELKQQAKDNPR